MTGMDELRICYKCDYETRNPLGGCPQCGHPLRTTTQIKRLGIMMTALGGFLTLFISGIAVVVAGIVLQSGNPHASARFTGEPGSLILIFGIFGVVLMFGLASLAAGIFQMKHGRRNGKLLRVILVLAGILMTAGMLVRIIL